MSDSTATAPPPAELSDLPCGSERTTRGDARRRAILDAACDLFLERGYDGVTMNEVVRRAGGSLATVYRCFGSKEGLFDAMIEEVSAEITAPLLAEELGNRPVADALQRVGERFLERLLAPDALAWHRVCVAEGPKHPGLRAALFRTGPGRIRERLADYLARQSRAGRLEIADPKLAAVQFLALVKASIHLEALCGEPVSVDEGAIRSHVERAVHLFLHGTLATDRP